MLWSLRPFPVAAASAFTWEDAYNYDKASILALCYDLYGLHGWPFCRVPFYAASAPCIILGPFMQHGSCPSSLGCSVSLLYSRTTRSCCAVSITICSACTCSLICNCYCYRSVTVGKVNLSLAFTADLPRPDRLKVLAEQAVARKKTELQASH